MNSNAAIRLRPHHIAVFLRYYSEFGQFYKLKQDMMRTEFLKQGNRTSHYDKEVIDYTQAVMDGLAENLEGFVIVTHGFDDICDVCPSKNRFCYHDDVSYADDADLNRFGLSYGQEIAAKQLIEKAQVRAQAGRI